MYLTGWTEGMLFLVKFFLEWMLFTRLKLKEGKVALPRARLWLLTAVNFLYKMYTSISTRTCWCYFQFFILCTDHLTFHKHLLVGLWLFLCLWKLVHQVFSLTIKREMTFLKWNLWRKLCEHEIDKYN